MHTPARSKPKRHADRPAPRPVNVLVVEDSEVDAQLLMYELRRQGFDPAGTRVDNGPALCQALEGGSWDVVLSDHQMPGFSGDEALRLVKERAPDVPFIVVSGTRGEDQAVEVMRAGASDFIVKSRLHRLAPVVERALDELTRRREQQQTANALAESQNKLRHVQRLEAVGRLAGGVAHDFNNLMATILTYADIALSSLPTDHATRTDIEEIKQAGARAAQLTRDLLVFSGQRASERSVLDLTTVIADIRHLLESVIGPSIALDVHHDECLWNVKADRMQVERALMNLAANARDAMRTGGTLTIETANVTVPDGTPAQQPETPGEYVRLRVRDTGDGMTPEVRDRIFEPFLTTKGERLGTGLGLAVVYGIVQQADGCIYAESTPGEGATFTIYLPRTTENVSTDPPA